MCIKTLYKHENIQIYRNACRKTFTLDYKRVHKNRKYKNM